MQNSVTAPLPLSEGFLRLVSLISLASASDHGRCGSLQLILVIPKKAAIA